MKGYYEKTLLDLRLSRSSIGCVLMSLLLSACGSTSSGQPELKPVEGWKDLKFGTAFDDALNSMPSFEWNPASLNGCYDKIALEGCTLFPDRDRAVLPLENGILYLPSLTFDKSGKLISVSSEYRNRGGINLSQCKDILQRTIDATVAEFGSLRWPKPTGDNRKG